MSSPQRRILVVDDNPAIHQDFRKILCPQMVNPALETDLVGLFGGLDAAKTEPSFELDFASQGQEALEMARGAVEAGRPYQMAFVDVRMPPGWDGIETIARIWEVDPGLQVAICTAFSDYSWDQMAAKLSQADKFVILKKPFDVIEVMQLANAFTEKWLLQRQVDEHTRKLQESEERYHFLANAVPGLVWTARPDGPIDYANRRLKEYSGRPFQQNQDWGWEEIVHPDDLQSCLQLWKKSLQSGDLYQVEYRLRRGCDGAYRWHLGRAVPMRDEKGEISRWVGSSIDIDDRKRAEQELRQAQANLEQRVQDRTQELASAKARLQAVLDSATQVAVIATDASGVITIFNRGAELMLGYTAAEMVGRQTPVFFLLESEVAAYGSELSKQLDRTVAGFDVLVEFARQGKHEEREWTCARKDGTPRVAALVFTALRDEQGNLSGFLGVAKDTTSRKRAEAELAEANSLFQTLLENSPDCIYFKDRQSHFIRFSKAFEKLFDVSDAGSLRGRTDFDFFTEDHARPAFEDEQEIIRTGKPMINKLEKETHVDGRVTWCLTTKMPWRDKGGTIIGTFGISKDVTAMQEAQRERQLMEVQLRQAQKLESIGQLAAGIAHEINTPTQYEGDNTRFLKDSFESIAKVVQAYDEVLRAAKSGPVAPALIARQEEILAASDLGYLFEQVPAAIRETLEGVERVAKIVRAMKEFSHPGAKEKAAADLNRAIETTVTVARNEWKYVADLELRLDPALPSVPCFVDEFNQCILNLVVNAAHAIGDVVKRAPGTKGRITVSTRRDGDQVEVRVSDTGTGIPEIHRSKIFEPFFTTKDVGKGTGQGLSIVYGNIVKKHGGTVKFETELGKGTTFILRLPVMPRAQDAKPSTTETGTTSGAAPAPVALTAP